jgi:hypothetical protein
MLSSAGQGTSLGLSDVRWGEWNTKMSEIGGLVGEVLDMGEIKPRLPSVGERIMMWFAIFAANIQ